MILNGDVAQLSRLFDWQSIGRWLDSHILHLQIKSFKKLEFFSNTSNNKVFLNFKSTINSYIFIL